MGEKEKIDPTVEKLFNLDTFQKRTLKNIAALSGLSINAVQNFFEYLVFSVLLEYLEEKEDKNKSTIIALPALGSLALRPMKNNPEDFDVFFSLNTTLKKVLQDAKKGDIKEISKYIVDLVIKKIESGDSKKNDEDD
jgi:hypothetical protein